MGDLNIKCRICWEEKKANTCVDVKMKFSKESGKSIKDVLLICVPWMSLKEGSCVCETCLWQLKLVYDFVQQCQKTEEILSEENKELPTSSTKLEDVFQTSLLQGNKIQIIFENPEKQGETEEVQVTQYLLEEPQIVNDNDIDLDPVSDEPTTSDVLSNISITKPTITSGEDHDYCNKAQEININFTNRVENYPILSEFLKPKGKNEDTTTNTEDEANDLVKLLDIAPVDMNFISLPTEMPGEMKTDLLRDGVNIINMSKDPTKKKRVLFFGRDYGPVFRNCLKCNGLPFITKIDYLDHWYWHRKDQINNEEKGEFTCTVCSRTFVYDIDLRNHTRLAHKISQPHLCTKCNSRFKTYKLYQAHCEKFKDLEKCMYKCPRCNKMFKNQYALKVHQNKTRDAPVCDYRTCKVCLQKFTKEDFRVHCKEHVNYLCAECGKSCVSSVSLQTHRKNVHNAVLSMCHQCGKVFKHPRMLQFHVDTVHGNQTFICEICARTFVSQVYLNKHIKKVHSKAEEKPFTCEECPRKFSEKGSLALHRKVVHLKQCIYKCTICGEAFPRNDYLKRHMGYHETYGATSCPVCRRICTSKSDLACHLQVGHDENGQPYKKENLKIGPRGRRKGPGNRKIELKCVCKICNKVLKNQRNLEIHYMAHLKLRKHKCETCGLTLRTKMTLLKHQKRHEDPNYKFRCEICHIIKSSELELLNHKMDTHQNLKYECKLCSAKFGRKHLLFDHETTAHPEINEKKQQLMDLLNADQVFLDPDVETPNGCRVGNKGLKIGRIEKDIDEVYNEFALKMDEANFNILSEEYQHIEEEEAACRALEKEY